MCDVQPLFIQRLHRLKSSLPLRHTLLLSFYIYSVSLLLDLMTREATWINL